MVTGTEQTENPIIKILSDSSQESTKSNISKVLSQIRKFQERVKKHIEQNYVDFQPNRTSADLYLEEGETLIREAEHLLHNTEADAGLALQEANAELSACIDELKEVSLGLKVSERILKVDDLFQCVEESNGTKEYLVVLDYLGKLKSLIFCESGEAVDRVFQRCECYDAIKVKYHIQANILQQNLQQRFDQLLQFSEKMYPKTKSVTLQISKDTDQLHDTVVALFQARYNPADMCKFLLNNCLEPLIRKPVSVELNENNTEHIKLTLSYSMKDLGSSLRPSYKQVFENILLLFNTLAGINVLVSPEKHVFSVIGDSIKEEFLQLLVNECLLNAIPETIDELDESTLVTDVVNFEQSLADIFFIETEGALFEFTEQFEKFFHERFFKKVLDNAKEIMQKDLQDMTVVSEKTTNKDVALIPFCFPQCMISKGTLELIKLMERLMRQPSEAQSDGVNAYLSVIPTIIDSYVYEVPKIHEKLLESIPQQSALFYNNCMYLAHWLAKNIGKSISTTPALVKTLQTIGTKFFNVQIAHQQKILKGILKELDLSDAHTLGQGQLKLIKQCLRQLELLKNVWQNVLPDAIYNSTFCDLLNDFCGDIIKRVLLLEDISATMANELSELIEIILQKAPTLYKDKHDVLQVKSWMKLQQLKMILNASLLEITEQWCEGAGILTANYKAEEIRHLIRALFQNTDRRAQALSKI